MLLRVLPFVLLLSLLLSHRFAMQWLQQFFFNGCTVRTLKLELLFGVFFFNIQFWMRSLQGFNLSPNFQSVS